MNGLTSGVCSGGGSVALSGRIPLRNVWLLLLYASELYREKDRGAVGAEENPDDIPDLVAEILVRRVERRLRRNLACGYRTRDAVQKRVRGRILHLATASRHLLDRGMVACRFDELTVDTPRNRYVKAALLHMAKLVSAGGLANTCRMLALSMERMGVIGALPSLSGEITDQAGRHDVDDLQMMTAARLAFNLALPVEMAHGQRMVAPGRDPVWLRHLFEKAVAGFYGTVLSAEKWRVESGRSFRWPVDEKTPGVDAILPGMKTDIILEDKVANRRIIIDTKFNEIVQGGWYRDISLRSGYLYQIYAYLRTQEKMTDPLSLDAMGMLLHPAIGNMYDERVKMQGHEIRFVTVDLGAEARAIRDRLLSFFESG